MEPLDPIESSQPQVATVATQFRKQIAAKKDAGKLDFLGVSELRMAEITEQACRRIDDCRSDAGLQFGHPIAAAGTWAYERQLARVMYNGNMEMRRAFGPLFLESNWSLNVAERIIRMLAAQHSGDLVGSDPFCAVMPEEVDDPDDDQLSKQIEKKIQDQIANCDCRSILAESIRVALTEGERPLKVTWDVDQTGFVGDATVMVDMLPSQQEGQESPQEEMTEQPPASETQPADEMPISAAKVDPIKTATGQYIFPKDDWLRFYVDEDGNSLGVFKPGEPPPDGVSGIQIRLKKEPSFILTGTPVYKLVKNLKQTLTHHRGLKVAGLFCEDFIYPIKVPSLQDPQCDITAHCYDEPLDSIEARYRAAGYREKYLTVRATGEMSQQNQPIRENGEYVYNNDSRKMVNVHETYYRCRVNEDDENESWLFIVIDYVTRVPIYAEYLGNMKMKRPPFVLLRGVQSEPGRAYGAGVYKMFFDKNLAIDVWFNRAALKSSKNSSLTFQHEDGWKAEYVGQKLVIGGTEIYKIPATAQDQYGPNHPPVFRVNMAEMSDQEYKLMDKLIQDGDLSFGVVNAAPLESKTLGGGEGGTATAVRNIERTGNILQRSTEELMATDLENLLDLIADTVLENLDPETVEWIPAENRLATLNRDEIRNLDRDARILMTKAKGEESLATNQQAAQLVEAYYEKPKWLQKDIRQFYVDQLKALFIADADQKLKEPTDEEIAAEANAQNNPPKEIGTIALKDIGPLTPDERAQALKLLGITASPPEQVSAMQGPPTVMPSPELAQPQPAPPSATAAA